MIFLFFFYCALDAKYPITAKMANPITTIIKAIAPNYYCYLHYSIPSTILQQVVVPFTSVQFLFELYELEDDQNDLDLDLEPKLELELKLDLDLDLEPPRWH